MATVLIMCQYTFVAHRMDVGWWLELLLFRGDSRDKVGIIKIVIFSAIARFLNGRLPWWKGQICLDNNVVVVVVVVLGCHHRATKTFM